MVVIESMNSKETCDNIEYYYTYRLTKTNMVLSMEDGINCVQAYGIEAERKDVVDGIVVNIDRESIKAISPERHKVHNLLKILCDNCVSPVHCIDILGEFVDEYVNDFDCDFENDLANVAMN